MAYSSVARKKRRYLTIIILYELSLIVLIGLFICFLRICIFGDSAAPKKADQYLVSHSMAVNCQVCYYANNVQQINFVICLCLKRQGNGLYMKLF